MSANQKLLAWSILGASVLIWYFARHLHPMVTPVLLGVTVLVLLRETGLFRGARLPLYAGIAVMIANAFIEVDRPIHLGLAILSMGLLAFSFWSRDQGGGAVSGNESGD